MTDERATKGVEGTSTGEEGEVVAGFARGNAIGRYVVLARRGAGGMGVVYGAYDPELDRKVAIKVLRPGRSPERTRIRLQREAQALAKLNHPAVVGVYDVGRLGEQVWLAMELVEGDTLTQWLRARRRHWREVLRVLVAAGTGLAAAHAKGLVHRDVKPDNLMVAEGRVVVMDFGLAQVDHSLADESIDVDDDDAPSGSQSSAFASQLTRVGALVGTPGYIAPEQHRGAAAQARSDQFAFCVTAWEALFGKRPFAAGTIAEETHATLNHAPRAPATAHLVPRWVQLALERGLARDPDARWPTMQELLDALGRDPSRTWWRAGGGVVVASLVSGAVWSWTSEPPSTARPCTGADDRLAGVWNDDVRAAIARSVLATDVPYAAETWKRVEPRLDAYGRAWVEGHVDACEASAVRGEQSAAILDARMRCLERARKRLAAIASVLTSSDRDVVEHAADLVDSLPSVETCTRAEALGMEVPPPPEHEVAIVDRVHDELAGVAALRAAGKRAQAQSRIAGLASDMHAVAYEPVHTDYELELGRVARSMGDTSEAETMLRSALSRALRWGQWTQAQRASFSIIDLFAANARSSEATAFLVVAEGLNARMPDPELASASVANHRGIVRSAQGRYVEAEQEYRAAIALLMQHAPDHPELDGLRNNLANALLDLGRFEEAEVEYRAGLASALARLGSEHPQIATQRHNLALVLHEQRRYVEAVAEHREALALRRRVLPAGHPDIAQSLGNLGNASSGAGRHDEAVAQLGESLDLTIAAFGPEHMVTALTRYNLGLALHVQGRLEDAAKEMNTAVDGLRRALGEAHPRTAVARSGYGQVLADLGRLDRAEDEITAALEAARSGVGPTHPHAIEIRRALASVVLKRGRPREALTHYESIWAGCSKESSAELRASAAWDLARALASTDGDRARARELAQTARDLYASQNQDTAKQIDAWIAEHTAK